MPVYSMTGYAQALGEPSSTVESGARNTGAAAAVAVELRSVNSRFLDLAFRMPDEMRALEPALRELLGTQLKRGKVEIRLSLRDGVDAAWPQPQPGQLAALALLQAGVQQQLPTAQGLSVNEVLHWCRSGAATPKVDELLMETARRAIDALNEARAREGAKLVEVLMQRVARLRELKALAEPLVPQVVARQRERFLERWQAALEASGASSSVPAEALQERALNEAAAFAIRIDVAEELARLDSHLDEIARLLGKGGEVGKRLDFLIQELLREANTLASKAAAIELTQIAVEMKVAIEQMREQVQNLE
ncbi:YicC/YloC family endoribonuclease [Rivibacter subsaxonicus]|uniref:Uncharacterized protein (TIGR00255 family) n=1 Tax=Rivibacter subsaxonicus TaxID=457575 RepID=A0A4Q7W1Z3_9BURK|nr:YicC/YloC family endoribonuclease [Rivibacter subsaxonicus]RZU02885.1 uncharacterized protein (TIGR00255 family) [Rivibacter subsaxonicus]